MKKPRKANSKNANFRCPYCGARASVRDATILGERKTGKILVCANFPECNSYVYCQKDTSVPLGTIADDKLRKMRIAAHRSFNQLFESGMMTKDEAYARLREYIIPEADGHIAMAGLYGCSRVIEECDKIVKGYRIACANKSC